jgi:hypothetical protein
MNVISRSVRLAATDAADADLIASCHRLVTIERRRDSVLDAKAAAEEEEERLIAELRLTVEKLHAPTSMEGARAMAAAAAALAPRNTDGGLLDRPDSLDGYWLAFTVAEFLGA